MIAAVTGSWQLLSRRRKIGLVLLAVGNLFLNLLDIVAISLIGVIGAIALGGTARLPFIEVRGEETGEVIALLMAVAGVLFLLKTATGVFLAKTQFMFLARIETGFSERIARHVLGADLSEVKRYSRSDLEWSVLRSTDIAFSRILGMTLVFVAQAGLALFILGLFAYTDWVSALLILVYFSIVLGLLQLFSHRKSKINGANVSQGSVSVGQAITDAVVAFKEITVLSRLDFFVKKIHDARSRVAIGNAIQLYLQSIPRLIVELALILGALGFVVVQSIRNDGGPDFGVLSIFIVGSLRMTTAVLPLQGALVSLKFFAPQALGAQTIIRETLTFDNEKLDHESSSYPIRSEYQDTGQRGLTVEVAGVNFSFTDRDTAAPVLHDVSLMIQPGQTVAFIGPSGAGKSTLVDLILGLHTPVSGRILCNGVPPREYRTATPGVIGYVPQKPGLVSGSVRQNVALGLLPEEIDEEALAQALEQAEIDEFVKSLPTGVDSSLGYHADSLSGGQIQRIGLARALYTKPRLLVLDEATSALDAETEASITASLRKLGNETTIIIVAHRLPTIQDADVIIVMDAGRIVATGSFKDLQESSSLVRKYVSLMTIR